MTLLSALEKPFPKIIWSTLWVLYLINITMTDFTSICIQIEDFEEQISELEARLNEKSQEVEQMQNELKSLKEFHKKRAQMQKELDMVCSINSFTR